MKLIFVIDWDEIIKYFCEYLLLLQVCQVLPSQLSNMDRSHEFSSKKWSLILIFLSYVWRWIYEFFCINFDDCFGCFLLFLSLQVHPKKSWLL